MTRVGTPPEPVAGNRMSLPRCSLPTAQVQVRRRICISMPTRPDQFPSIARQRAQSSEVARLFERLTERAEVFARMLDEFTDSITRNRAAREGRPVRLSTRQQRRLTEFDRDAEQALRNMERHTASLDDAALLTSALSGIEQQTQLDEHMLPGFHDDDKPMATQLLNYCLPGPLGFATRALRHTCAIKTIGDAGLRFAEIERTSKGVRPNRQPIGQIARSLHDD